MEREKRPAQAQAEVAMVAAVENRDDDDQPSSIEERPAPTAGSADSSVLRRSNTVEPASGSTSESATIRSYLGDIRTPSSPLPIGKTVLSKEDTAEDQVFGGHATGKSNSKFKKEVETIIAEFGKMIQGHEDKLRSVVFAKKDFAIALVGQNGCRLGFTDGSAFLDIPAGALDADRTIYMYRLPEDTDVTGPNDEKKIFSYSPLICCGPDGLAFKENVTLNFEHWAAPVGDQGDVNLVLFERDNERFPWQDTRNVFINSNRVEHHLSHFCQRCYGYEDLDAQGTPGLKMCLMIAVSRADRHCVETVLMRDDTSVINAHKNDFIDVREFAADEVHVIKGISIDPTKHVTYESGKGFTENSPNDWHQRHFYGIIIPTLKNGRFNLNLRQDNRHNAAIRISEHGDVDTDLELDQSFLYTHYPVQVEEPFGRVPIQCPDEARVFAERHSLQSYDGNRSREQRLPFPLDTNLGCLNLPLEEVMERQVQKTRQEEAGSARSSQRFERQGST